MFENIKTLIKEKYTWWTNIRESRQYKLEQSFLSDITFDFITTLRLISLYSRRASHIYDSFLTITTIDDLIESSIAILSMVNNGILNTSQRELRYILEMAVKYGVTDWKLMGKSLEDKIRYFNEYLPKSSISPIDDMHMPFVDEIFTEFKNDVKRIYSNKCKYVHPSKQQLEEQIRQSKRGYTIGYESATMLKQVNRAIFEVYDIILSILFSCFGESMSRDIFDQILNDNTKWKFHKGKYTSATSNELNCKP